ncbi:MAG: DEAD/DEAH box helicase [Oleiphilaceae bacterium]|nr:DEAD/DEAH box helicase [Oleiphilaceae bacterium]
MSQVAPSFSSFNLSPAVLQAVTELGYESPSPIQAAAIPAILEGRDVLGQAQTGTGKTAAFALPLLSKLEKQGQHPQLLILTPTRELAIQVAEACQSYAKFLDGFHVLPIYGGQGYSNQLRLLKRGAQVVVGTPGRVMDHMRRGTLKLDNLRTLVLDEADEMLRMGFIDDVTWILEHCPEQRQIALFSATMPREIQRVADTYLKEPEHIKVAASSNTASTIRQRYWLTAGIHKLDALTRVLEVEEFDGMIIFVRTKLATEELANKLNARGFSAAPLHGDIPQAGREKVVERLKRGDFDILVATDVVARGLDVERISHVVNYDVPYDVESYIHRIGRTGRAGRSGDAILFIAPREKRMLRAIEKASGKTIEQMQVPTAAQINLLRVEQFKQSIVTTMQQEDTSYFEQLLQNLRDEIDADPLQIAAALAHLHSGERSLLLDTRGDHKLNQAKQDKSERHSERKSDGPTAGPIRPLRAHPDVALNRYIIAVGKQDGATPAQIVAAIANAADMSSEYIGQIELYDKVSTVDLPDGMPNAVFKLLAKTRVANRPMALRPFDEKNEKPKLRQKSKGKAPKSTKKRKDKTTNKATRSKAGTPRKRPVKKS